MGKGEFDRVRLRTRANSVEDAAGILTGNPLCFVWSMMTRVFEIGASHQLKNSVEDACGILPGNPV